MWARAMAGVNGVPSMELIFIHWGRGDGSDARRLPARSASSDLKIASKQ